MMDNRRSEGRAWLMVLFAFLFMLINYADKAVIGLSAVPIMKELHLSHAQFGSIGSSFFLLFAISGVLVGFVLNRVPAKPVLLTMSIVWALAQFPLIGTVGLGVLFASRIVLGAGEGPAFPAILHAVYKWFPDRLRTLPTGIVASGASFGAGIVAPGIAWIIVTYGWHAAFGVLGAVGLLWALAWQLWGAEGDLDTAAAAANAGRLERLPYRTLLLSRTAIGVFIAGFAAYWVLTLSIVWLASYLMQAAGYNQMQAGWIITLPSFSQIVLAPTLAWVSQRLVRSGVPSRLARGAMGGACIVVAGAAMTCLGYGVEGAGRVVAVALAFSIGSVIFTLGSALIGEITPPVQRGALLGITNSIQTLAGLLAPVVMGLVVDVGANPALGFRTGFTVVGWAVIGFGIVGAILMNPERDLARFRAHSKAPSLQVPASVVNPG